MLLHLHVIQNNIESISEIPVKKYLLRVMNLHGKNVLNLFLNILSKHWSIHFLVCELKEIVFFNLKSFFFGKYKKIKIKQLRCLELN